MVNFQAYCESHTPARQIREDQDYELNAQYDHRLGLFSPLDAVVEEWYDDYESDADLSHLPVIQPTPEPACDNCTPF